MKKVAILDLLLAKCIFHSTPRPTKAGMLISGWHKTQGDSVVLADEFPNPAWYDIIYIIKDGYDLVHDPQWLQNDNVVLVGNYWEMPVTWNVEWENALPDKYLYRGWAERWMAKYPSVSMKRMLPFFMTPFLIKRGDKIVEPEGKDLLIIDDDMHVWDADGKLLAGAPISNARMLYPISLDGRWEAAINIYNQKHIYRELLWFDFHSTISDEELGAAIELMQTQKLSRMFRMRLHSTAHSDAEWDKEIKRCYHILGRIRMEVGKRVRYEPHNIHCYSHPRIIMEMKRWTGRGEVYNKNSVLSYMLMDGCRDLDKMANFIHDPYKYLTNSRMGSNKLVDLVSYIEQKPHMVDIISTSYPKGGN